jgi:hypothetical protein
MWMTFDATALRGRIEFGSIAEELEQKIKAQLIVD